MTSITTRIAAFVLGIACCAPALAQFDGKIVHNIDPDDLPDNQTYAQLSETLGTNTRTVTAIPNGPLLSSGPIVLDHSQLAGTQVYDAATFEVGVARTAALGFILQHDVHADLGPLLRTATDDRMFAIVSLFAREVYLANNEQRQNQPLSFQVEASLRGSMRRPTNAVPGITQMSAVFNFLSTVFGNPVQTALFSGGISLQDQGAPQTIGGVTLEGQGAAQGSGSVGVLSNGDPNSFTYSSPETIFQQVQVREGEPFTLSGDIFASLDVDPFDSLDGSSWQHDFTFELRLIAPEGTTFVAIPEPAALSVIALSATLLAARRRTQDGRWCI